MLTCETREAVLARLGRALTEALRELVQVVLAVEPTTACAEDRPGDLPVAEEVAS